jgi:hypothetical protein
VCRIAQLEGRELFPVFDVVWWCGLIRRGLLFGCMFCEAAC